MKKASPEQVLDFRCALPAVAALLELEYRGIQPWCRHFRLSGRRSYKGRYGLPELVKFRLVSLLLKSGFSTKQTRDALGFVPWMTASDHDAWFIVRGLPDGDVDILRFDSLERFFDATKILAEAGIPHASFSLAAIAQEILERVQCHLDRVPYISSREKMVAAFRSVRNARMAEEVKQG